MLADVSSPAGCSVLYQRLVLTALVLSGQSGRDIVDLDNRRCVAASLSASVFFVVAHWGGKRDERWWLCCGLMAGWVPDRSVSTNSERKWAERKCINPNPGLLLKD